MRTTLIIDDAIFEKASELTGIKEKASLVRVGLEAHIAKESAKRLARLGWNRKEVEEYSSQKTGIECS